MKKLATLLLSFALLLCLAACGGSETPNVSVKAPDTPQNSEDVGDSDSQGNNDKVTNQIIFDGLVAVDNEECTIKISEINPDDMWGFSLKTELENKSAEKTYMFSVQSAAINGVQCEPLFASEVAPGKKANDKISFSSSSLKENGIGDYTDIELTFRVYDSDDWFAESVAKETVHVYPYGEDKAVTFVRETQPSDNVIADNEYVAAIVTGYENNTIWGYTVKLFLLNKTEDKNVMFSVNDASVNGYMADPFFATSVSAGKCAFSSMSWSDNTLQENGINEVSEIEFVLRVYDADNWFDDGFFNDTVILNP